MRFEVSLDHSNLHPILYLKDNEYGTMAEIYAFGGLLNAFQVAEKETIVNVIDGFTSVNEAINQIAPAFKSARLSPFTCRMRNGRYSLNGNSYQVAGYYMGAHAIHGLLYQRVFTIVSVNADSHAASATLRFHYEGNDPGYPFPFTQTLTWKLEPGNRLSVSTTVLHTHAFSIPYADGWHPYFTLGSTIDDCRLQINSKARLVFDEDLLPSGATETDERFTKGSELNNIFLDNCFVLDPSKVNVCCTLENERLRLEIIPDAAYPFLQVYTPAHRNSIALENLSGAPDCFNNGLGLLLLAPNEATSFTTSYAVTFL